MAAIDPGIRNTHQIETLLRQGTRIAVVAFYVTALVVALLLVRPAFRDVAAPVVAPKPVPPRTDTILKGESVATFAARHGLDLGEVLALNPSVNSLSLPAGTKLRIG
jgi:LysM domain-containing protein